MQRVLFGAAPDRIYQNFRLREILTLLHSTELVDYVKQLDNRITYWPFDDRLFDSIYGYNVESLVGPLPPTGIVVGPAIANDIAGRAVTRWRATVLSGNRVEIMPEIPAEEVTIADYSDAGGIYTPVTLPLSQAKLRVPPDANVGDSWRITETGRPAWRLLDVYSRLQMTTGTAMYTWLFDYNREPYPTFRTLWNSHPHWQYRLSGAILAHAFALSHA